MTAPLSSRSTDHERKCRCGDMFEGLDPPWWGRTDYGLCPACRELPEFRAMADEAAREAAIAAPDSSAASTRPGAARRSLTLATDHHSEVEPVETADDWPPFVPLASNPPVAKLTQDMLPSSLVGWIWDIAERQDMPPEFVAVPALIAASALVGRRVGVAPKARDDWTEIPNLYGMVVAHSGAGKTPAELEALEPYRELAEKAQNAPPGEGPPPPYEVGDATVEVIGVRMEQIKDGRALLVIRSELSGLFAKFSSKGHEGDRAFYLEAHDGKTHHRVDRLSREAVNAVACIALYGGIQPGAMARLVTKARSHGSGADGLLQRFGLAVFPDPKLTYRRVDRPPDDEARQRADQALARLLHLDPAQLGASPVGRKKVPALRFAPNAQRVFDEWHDALVVRSRRNDEGHSDAFGSYLAKLRGLAASLALLFHLLDHEGTTSEGVDRISTDRALAFAAYLEQHARKIYREGDHQRASGARALASLILEGEITSGKSLRDAYHLGRSGLKTRCEAIASAKILEQRGWLRLEFRQRRSIIIRLRPDLAAFLEQAIG